MAEMTEQEIATALGVSRQYVHHLLQKVMKKFKKKLRIRGIKNYADISIEQALNDIFTGRADERV